MILNLGQQCFTGVFPLDSNEDVPTGELALMHCGDCSLVQLREAFPAHLLYGDNYGYRSGLNASMVSHLQRIVHSLENAIELSDQSVVLDIGSNDGTLLSSYTNKAITRIGIDPTAQKFREFYNDDVIVVSDFFSRDIFQKACVEKAEIITSIAMLYDLEDPVAFATDIESILADDGIWYFEQSYAPWMLTTGAYDTICHEHLEYYSLQTIKEILDRANLQILEATTNSANGGSIAVTARKSNGNLAPVSSSARWLLEQEKDSGVNTLLAWKDFSQTVSERMKSLHALIKEIKGDGQTIVGLGASTKGNVLLQAMGFNAEVIDAIGDVNPYKFGRVTPGTHIPIVPENDVLAMSPDYALVLPWHFRESLLSNLDNYLANGGKLIFPLPFVEVVTS